MGGLLLVFEGGDRCGKTTQCMLLRDHLQRTHPSRRVTVFKYPERATTTTGPVIDLYLHRSLELHPTAASLLLASNLWEISARIMHELDEGHVVLMDRYVYSSLAYSTVRGMPYTQCEMLTAGLPRPDLVFYFKLGAEDVEERTGFGMERFETAAFQSKVYAVFDRVASTDAAEWVTLDCTRSIASIQGDIVERVGRLLE